MKLWQKAQYIIFSGLMVIGWAECVLAQGLLITDCHGFTRALHSVNSGELNTVKIAVSNPTGAPVTGAEVSLTNSATGEVVSAVAENGFATFEGVAPGSFTVSTTATNATVGTVSVSGAGAGTAAAAGAAGVTGATAGGGAIKVSQEVDDRIINDDKEGDSNGSGGSGGGGSDSNNGGGGGSGGNLDDGDATPTPTPTVEPTVEPTPESTPFTPPPTPRPTPDCDDCDPDARPPALDEDDFFNSQRLLSPSR